ncbi:hypothetical protein QO010_000574 [Caulobacter ginsengisoli]|uniref:CENP-V/GFA domain-containing protein n=1 Tax=Caulobacter ginsengisoli TaxID=400775 RepID=A0ABU0IN55_9CAUL|nr:GFA family protein [Caulobacter ginsengisoli]MDQ0462826.1 hypothetical protein [Caulobacter ginsengisoli]
MRAAACHCGQLSLTCEGEPRKISQCHCSDCQRRTGSVFSIAAFFDRAAVTVSGEAGAFTRDSGSGHPVTFRFCPKCGSNLWWEPARMPDRIGVAVGAFADPGFPPPEQSVWNQDRHAWVALREGVPAFEQNPPPR